MRNIALLATIALVSLLCTPVIVLGAPPTARNMSEEPSDTELLNATPIPPARMELVWLDPPKLEALAAQVKAAGGSIIAEYYDTADNYRREYKTTWGDIVWAKKVEKIVDIAYDAGRRGQYYESIKYYKQALLLAPGSDLFLMSIGVAYVQVGEKERGIRFLEKAASISPKNSRIRRNLEAAQGY